MNTSLTTVPSVPEGHKNIQLCILFSAVSYGQYLHYFLTFFHVLFMISLVSVIT